MRLTEAQSRELLRKHGVYVTEVCDGCGKILGHVRFTRFGEKGEWCSYLCRDGVERKAGICRGCGANVNRKRKDALYCNDACKMRASRKNGKDSEIIRNARIQKAGLTDAILPSGYTHSLKLEKSCHEPAIREL
jgi:hypothetical protein